MLNKIDISDKVDSKHDIGFIMLAKIIYSYENRFINEYAINNFAKSQISGVT